MIRTLSGAQRAKTIIAPETSGEDFTTAFRDNLVLDYAGIRYDELSNAQHDLLLQLVDYHVGRMRDGHAEIKMAEVKRHLKDTHFCWMGGMEDDSTFYYRVQSPVIIVEFDHQRGIAFREHTKPYKDHIHVIVRTPNGNDYGKDLLRQHYQYGHHAGEELIAGMDKGDANEESSCCRLFLILLGTVWLVTATSPANAQANLKKVRIGVSETHVGYLPLQVAFHKGYYKDEGIDLEIVLMPTNVINTAALTGQIDINGAVTGTVGAAVQGSPMKLLIVTVGKPLLFLVSRKEIKDPRELKRKENRRQLARRLGDDSGETGPEPLRPRPRKGRRGVAHGRIDREPLRRHGERRGGRDRAAGAGGDFRQGEGL